MQAEVFRQYRFYDGDGVRDARVNAHARDVHGAQQLQILHYVLRGRFPGIHHLTVQPCRDVP